MIKLVLVLVFGLGLSQGMSIPPPDASGVCGGAEWTFYQEGGTCFLVDYTVSRHVNAHDVCHQKGATLAQVKTREAMSFVRENVYFFVKKIGDAHIGLEIKGDNFTWNDGTVMTEEETNSLKPFSHGHYCVSLSFTGLKVTHCDKRLASLCMKKEMDMCLYDNGGCHHYCTSNNGTVVCGCLNKFYLHNQTHCVEKNPCDISNGGCDQLCLNTEPGKKACTCKEGFILDQETACAALNTAKPVPIMRFTLAALVFIMIVLAVHLACTKRSAHSEAESIEETSSSNSSSFDEHADESSSPTSSSIPIDERLQQLRTQTHEDEANEHKAKTESQNHQKSLAYKMLGGIGKH